MSPSRAPYLMIVPAVVLAVVFVALVRVPVPFDYATAVWAGLLAMGGTLAICFALPSGWLWSDAERLTHAFEARHGITGAKAKIALEAIGSAHARAEVLRDVSSGFVDDLRAQAEQAADRLDASAREIFYDPDRLTGLRSILVRSALIEEAATAHKVLKSRAKGNADAEVATSRAKLAQALDALDQAFAASDLSAARGLLSKVDAASSTAETLLAPRRALNTLHDEKDKQP